MSSSISGPPRGTRVLYVVDQQGGTFWFERRKDAEEFLVAEAWGGAVHLSITSLPIPDDVEDVVTYAMGYVMDHVRGVTCEAYHTPADG